MKYFDDNTLYPNILSVQLIFNKFFIIKGAFKSIFPTLNTIAKYTKYESFLHIF